MGIINTTPFVVGEYLHLDREGNESVTVVVKATLEVVGGVGTSQRADEQEPIRYTDELTDPQNEWSSLALPCDLGPGKRGTDVIVQGNAFFPVGAKCVDVEIRVGPLSAPLRIHGPRLFQSGALGVVVGEARHVDQVPIIYEKAYGGRSPDYGLIEERNPSGVGVSKTAAELDGQPAPQIEHPQRPHRKAKDHYPPMGYGPIPHHWSPRKEYYGTVSTAWRRTRMPLLPEDFDARFNNWAHPSLLLKDRLRGGEPVLVNGMSPMGALSFDIPNHAVVFRARFDEGEERRVSSPDTLIIYPESARYELMCRETFRIGRRNRLRVVKLESE